MTVCPVSIKSQVYIALGLRDGSVLIRSLLDREFKREVKCSEKRISCLSFCSARMDNARLIFLAAGSDDGYVRMYDLGELLKDKQCEVHMLTC
jgi:hypothetical protein